MKEDCIFCKLSEDLPSDYLEENEFAYAIFDIKPITKGHTLVIPKTHFENLATTEDKYLQETILMTKRVANKLKKIYPDIQGFRYLSNQGKAANQVVFHLHIHIIPKY